MTVWNKTERKSCDIIDPLSSRITIHRPHFIVRLLIFQSRCCLSENWSARENTHSELGAHSVNRNQDKVRLSSLSAVALSPLLSVGGAGLGREIFIIISQLLTIYDKSQCWYVVCWRAHSPTLCNQSPTDHPFCQNPLKRRLLVPVSAQLSLDREP